MAYLFRSIAVIGLIAFHSPTHRPPPLAAPAANPAPAHDIGSALAGFATARDAAAVISTLDPQARDALLGMLTASIARAAGPDRSATR